MAGLQQVKKKQPPTLLELMEFMGQRRPLVRPAMSEQVARDVYGNQWTTMQPEQRIWRRIGNADQAMFPNRDLVNELVTTPGVQGTNFAGNPYAYVDPAASTHVHQDRLYAPVDAGGMYTTEIARGPEINGVYRRGDDKSVHLSSPMQEDQYGTPTGTDAAQFAKTLAHENIHKTYDERGMYDQAWARRMQALRETLLKVRKKAIPAFTRTDDSIDYGQSEAEAYVSSEEAMLPQGQLPVREALKPYNLEQIYDRATVRGPTASSTKPTLWQRAGDYLEGVPGLGWGKY